MIALTGIAGYVLGWLFVLVGFAVMVANNHSIGAGHYVTGDTQWWASLAAFPVGALFWIAAGLSHRGFAKAEAK